MRSTQRWSGVEVKDTTSDHPVRAHAAIVDEMGVEETARGPLLLVGGNRLFIPRGERRRLLDLLHSTHLGERTMIETARKIWYWGGMNNQIRQRVKSCERCQEEAAAKPRQPPVIPDDLTRMKIMEMVGVDLFELGGRSYLVMVDKHSGFRFCSFLGRTATTDVQGVLEKWFYQFGIPSRLRSDGGPQFREGFTR